METQNKVTLLRTYAKTWEFDYVLYGYGDFTLPFPLRVSQIGFFMVSLLLVLIIDFILPFKISWLLRIALAIGLTHVGTNLDIDGKKPYIWLPKQIMYFVTQPKRINRFETVDEYKAVSFNPMRPVNVK